MWSASPRCPTDPLPDPSSGSRGRAFGRPCLQRLRHPLRPCRLGIVGALLALIPARAVTLSELRDDPKLTPKRFADYFETFDFEAHDEVQLPEVFLASRRGDCDDYAILASHVLRPRGYSVHLIHVRLVGRFAHAVCYVAENQAYLDYNNRIYYTNLERCGRTLREIATHVADTLEANWTSVSEFTYDYREDVKHMLATVVKTEPAANDPDHRAPLPPP